MFDVGFLEISVILVLGLLVLGPERLPKAAQKVGYWLGKGRRYVQGMKAQVEAEFDTSEVKRLLHNQEVQIRELQNKISDTKSVINDDYQNQFDDDDPGSSHEEAAQANLAGPQYDIIEEDLGSVIDDSDTKPAIEEAHPIEEPHPVDSAMSEVIKRNE